MKRSVISLVLVLCLLCSCLPAAVSAAEVIASGKLSLTDIEWTLDDTGLLYLSGTGPMTACDEDVNTGWKDYVYDITAGYIEDGITDIGVYCFDRCLSMKTVYMPDSITVIESHAFEWCRGLTGITLPANLEVIGSQTFYNCDGLETVEFNGKLSILPVSKKRPANPEDLNLSPAPEYIQTEVIMDGRVLDENLKRMGLDDKWLHKQLTVQGYKKPQEVFLALCDENNQLTVFAME